MKSYPVTLLQIGILSSARAIAAAGLALAVSARVAREKRGPIGWSLFGVGSILYLSLIAGLVLRNRERPS